MNAIGGRARRRAAGQDGAFCQDCSTDRCAGLACGRAPAATQRGDPERTGAHLLKPRQDSDRSTENVASYPLVAQDGGGRAGLYHRLVRARPACCCSGRAGRSRACLRESRAPRSEGCGCLAEPRPSVTEARPLGGGAGRPGALQYRAEAAAARYRARVELGRTDVAAAQALLARHPGTESLMAVSHSGRGTCPFGWGQVNVPPRHIARPARVPNPSRTRMANVWHAYGICPDRAR